MLSFLSRGPHQVGWTWGEALEIESRWYASSTVSPLGTRRRARGTQNGTPAMWVAVLRRILKSSERLCLCM
jgi:hypothetical protein